jgi:type VI secretion system secreted protein VgrG
MSFTQANRPIAIHSPLGADVLLLEAIAGSESISELFAFQLDMLADSTKTIAFDKILGQAVSIRVEIPGKKQRWFHGIVGRFSQGGQIQAAQGDVHFIRYRAELVPKIWLLTRIQRSRIFQQKTVLQILQVLFAGYDVDYSGVKQSFKPRDYCVQYRETDFHFASRLMEEEGIFWFFKHEENKHTLLLGDQPAVHATLPVGPTTVLMEAVTGGTRDEDRVIHWSKTQEVRSGKVTYWDHCFEMPDKNLESQQTILESVALGTVTHKLKVAGNDKLEHYDYPGHFAQRFDGIAPGGGEAAANLKDIQPDGTRTVGLRMQEEARAGVLVSGTSNCRHFIAGFKFTLDRHFDANGDYVLTRVQHKASLEGAYTSPKGAALSYKNEFECIPSALPYRPLRRTAKARVAGAQTAVVVGPKGQEIFTDKYGRVKVQFFWDREGKKDANSSCWIRVATAWAGKRWGITHIPRVGQEVIVDFLEGDPDQPIIVGSVYNADQMPPYLGEGLDSKHKHVPNLSGIKTNTTVGGQGYNEIRFDDTKDKQQVYIHGERNLDVRIKNDAMELVLNDRHLIVGQEKDGAKKGDQFEKVFHDKHLQVMRNQVEQIGGNLELLVGGGDGDGNVDISIKKDKKELIAANSHFHVKGDQKEKIDGKQHRTVGGDRLETVNGAFHLHVKGACNEKVDGNQSLNVAQNYFEKAGANYALDAGAAIHLKAGATVVIEAGAQLTIKAGPSFVVLGPDGVSIQGPMVKINSGGAAGSGGGSQPAAPTDAEAPTDAKDAKPTAPVLADDSASGVKSAPG